MYSVELKIKRVSLADEARRIRKEEHRMKLEGKTDKLNSLHSHRLHTVRVAARSAHLAHTYLRMRRYATVESLANTRTAPPLEGIVKNLQTFGQFDHDKKELTKLVMAWVDEGAAPVGAQEKPEAAA